MRIVVTSFLILCAAGCMSLTPESRIPLLASELDLLRSGKDIAFENGGVLKGNGAEFAVDASKDKYDFYVGSFRDRLVKYSKSLKLTSDELKALEGAGNPTFCGKCGNLKGLSVCCAAGAKSSSYTKYAADSLIDRILGY